MSTSTLSRRRTRHDGALVVVGPGEAGREQPEPKMPDWAQAWARLWGWQLRWYTGMGPGAAAAAAAPGVRALLLRPDTPTFAPHAEGRRPHVVAALQDLPDDAAVVKDAVRCAAGCGAALTFVHAVPRSFGQRSVDLTRHSRTVCACSTPPSGRLSPRPCGCTPCSSRTRSSCGCGRTSSSGRSSMRTCWWSAGRGSSTGRPSAGGRSSPAVWGW